MNIWDQILEYLQVKLSPEAFGNWLSGTSYLGLEDGTLFVAVPDQETCSWLEAELAVPVKNALQDLHLSVARISYQPQPPRGALNRAHASLEPIVPAGPASNNGSPAMPGLTSGTAGSESDSPSSALNPHFSFESFVVGTCNHFAHAAARSVADHPARSYNPLFLYGGVGMGKTHLMHAIGRELMDQYSTMRVIYTSSEKFMNEMISCIRTERMPQFHQRYRAADVLLIDDIQLLGNKERTQEEFFHTFNELHDHQKQIVISSDAPSQGDSGPAGAPAVAVRMGAAGRHPAARPGNQDGHSGQEGRGRRRHAAGRCADLHGLQDQVERARTGRARWIKLMAYSSLTGAPIHLAMAQQVLKHLVHVQDRRVTIDAIQKAVAERFEIKQSQLKEKSNTKKVVYPRQVAMYLVKELTDASLPEIGRAFGGKHHTTVIHSVNKIEKVRQSDPELNRLLHSLMDSLQ